jgi:hypothetical protein
MWLYNIIDATPRLRRAVGLKIFRIQYYQTHSLEKLWYSYAFELRH